MDTPINADIIAFASDLALAVNVIGAVIFVAVMRRLWAGHEKHRAPSRHAPSKIGAAEPCPG
jgi:hypothetical protein